MKPEILASQSSADLSDAIGQMQAASANIHRSMLELIRVYDKKKAWAADGTAGMEGWLVFQLGIPHRLASDWVSVANALDSLPLLSAAYSEGRLCWEQVRALCRVATAENEEEFIERAIGMTAAQVETMVRLSLRISTEQAKEDRSNRTLSYGWDQKHQWFRLSGRLYDADGAVVEKALDLIIERTGKDPDTGQYGPHGRRAADALIELASTELAQEADSDRALVVLHVDQADLEAAHGVAEIEKGPLVSSETARRIACDASRQLVVDGPDGQPVGIGRKSRLIPPWLARQIRHRDKGCRFPGCFRNRWLKHHHIHHWAKGGPTDRDNLVSLCGFHHGLVHEGGWSIRGKPNESIRFVRPDGRLLEVGPPPALRPEIKERLAAFV